MSNKGSDGHMTNLYCNFYELLQELQVRCNTHFQRRFHAQETWVSTPVFKFKKLNLH